VSKWIFADVWETVADVLPDAPALTHGDRTTTWSELDHRADRVARWLLAQGVEHQDKVALYLYNGPEYLEATFACLKLGLVPVNTNYRYADDELVYLWENADSVAVVFHGTFVERIQGSGTGCPGSGRGSGSTTGLLPARRGRPLRGGGGDTGSTGSRLPGTPTGAVAPHPDDLYMLYTGGTTGMPKGSCGDRTTCSPVSTAADSGAIRGRGAR